MADETEEADDDVPSEKIVIDKKDGQNLRASDLEVSPGRISEPQTPREPNVISDECLDANKTRNRIAFQLSDGGGEKLPNAGDEKSIASNRPRQPRSACRARSRDTRQCQKHFQEMIGKHETRNDELERREGDLRQRMEMLECSMPAVMTWNIWRMSQNAPASTVRRLLEKQFKDHGGDVAVPSTPSQHYDCRVREIESERKEALRRAEEARVLLAEKEAAVEERKKLLEEAKKCNQERREKMERLNREAIELRSALKNARGDDNSCETGECGEIRCQDKWLENVGSVSSIGSTDLECFTKLQELAEAEICMKQQISELERREEAYMRTLQQADELWLKMEGDTADTVSELQSQLDSKAAANQQLADRICSLEDELEKSKTRLISCKDALLKFTDKKFSDVEIGYDDGEVNVTDRGVVAAIKTATASTSATPTIVHQETLAFPEVSDKESSVHPETTDAHSIASVKMSDKDAEANVDQIHRGVDRPTGLEVDASVGDDEAQNETTEDGKTDALRKVKRRDSKSIEAENDGDDEVVSDKWKDWDWDQGCPPGAICDDMLESSTGTDDLERPKGVPTTESKVQATPEVADRKVGGRDAQDLAAIGAEVELRSTDASDQATGIPMMTKTKEVNEGPERTGADLESDQIVLSREELRNWYNIVDSVHHEITKCVNCSSKRDDIAQLADKMKMHLKIKGFSGVKEPTAVKDPARSEDAVHHAELSSATESPALDVVRKITDEVNLLPVEVEQLESGIASKTSVSSEDKIRPEITEPEVPIHSTERSKESEFLALSEFQKIVDGSDSGPVEEEKLASIVGSKTSVSSEDRIRSKITTAEVPVHTTERSDETESSAPSEVRKIVDDFNLLPTGVEQLPSVDATETSVWSEDKIKPRDSVDSALPAQTVATNEVSENLVPSENGIRPEVTMDSTLPVEAVTFDTITEVSGIKLPIDAVDQIPETSEQQIDVSKERSSEKRMFVATPKELSKEVPKEVAEFNDDGRKKKFHLETTEPAVREDIVVATEGEAADITGIPIDETLTDPIELSEELAKTLLAPIKLQVESEDFEEPSAEVLRDSEEVEMKQPVVVPELPVGVEEQKFEVDNEEGARVEETAVSFITPRTPPPSRMDVQFHPTPDDVPDGSQQTSESVVESFIKFEELDRAEERSQQEIPSRPVTEDMPEDETEYVTPEIPGSQDEDRLEVVTAEVPEKISSTEQIIEPPEPSTIGTPCLPTAEEFVKKIKLPKALDRCICKPRTCPLLRRIASRESKLKPPKLFTEGTQTSPRVPTSLVGMLDKLKLKTITGSTWPSPGVTIWRRPMVWSKRPTDKSTLTTPCVDTQTDSALVRERIMLEGINRKAHTTCSGFRPRYTEYAGCRERISPQPAVPVDLAASELLDVSLRLPMSMASSVEKEIAVVKYEGRSLTPQDNELRCVECGRPITPNGTPLSEKCSSSIGSKSQRSIMASLKKVSSSTSRLARKKNAFACCECKASDNSKMQKSNEPCKIGMIKKLSKEATSAKGPCCPCPVDISKTMPTKLPKSRKKKRRPEKKDQSVMTVISKSKTKPLSEGMRNDAAASVIGTEGSSACVSSETRPKINSSSSSTKTTLNSKKLSKCRCSEDSITDTSLTKQSSCCREDIPKSGSNDKSSVAKSLTIGSMSRDHSSIASVPSEEGSCNCLPPTP